MRRVRALRSRIAALFAARRLDAEFDEEIRAHLDLLADEHRRRGLSPIAARAAALRDFGGVEHTKELRRDARAFVWLGDARQDGLHAIRLLRRSPLFTVAAACSLAIGIGANAAVFAVASAMLFRAPDGIADPSTLIDIGTRRGDGGLNPMPFSTYLKIAPHATTVSGLFAQQMFPRVTGLSVSSTAVAERVYVHYVTTDFFTVLRARPAAGRVFDRRDGNDRTSAPVAVLSHGFWVRRFSEDPNVIGQAIRLNGRAFTVVGVAAPRFQGTGILNPDVWLPLSADGGEATVLAGGRLQPGASATQVAAELTAARDSLERERGAAPRGQPLHALPSSPAGGNRNIVIGFAAVLMTIVSLVLAVASANVAGLILARSTTRSREMAVRTALGAGRGRLVRQLLTETMMLFLLGGALGLAVARLMLALIPLLPSLPMPVSVPLRLDAGVMAFTALLSLTAALASGLAPAFQGSKTDPATALKHDSSSLVAGSLLRSVLVAGQVALSVLLIVMAGLLLRALRYAGSSDPGFDPRDVEIAALDLSMAPHSDSARLPFWRDLLQAVRQLPDVEAASLARVPPGGFEGIGLGTVAAAGTPPSAEPFNPAWNIVDSGYFMALRIPLVAGRDFADGDVAGAQPVAILGEEIARRFWPGQRALGQHLAITLRSRDSTITRDVLIVGVARDVKSSSLIDGLAGSYVYLPLHQADTPQMALMTTQMTIVARSRHGRRVSAELGAVVRSLNPNLPIVRSEMVKDSIALGLAPQQLLTTVTGSLGLLGLLLAAIGIYGVTAYSVAHRTRELGIRLALGAPPHHLVRMVLGQGFLLTAVGSFVGLALAAGAGQVVSLFLYGLPALHLPTFLGTAILFVLVGLTACYIPARRALGVDPLRALRYE
jgi:putative ABC transport system permease protein